LDVWTILILNATVSIVGIVGLLYECWKSVRASEMPYGSEPQSQQVGHEPQSTYDLGCRKFYKVVECPFGVIDSHGAYAQRLLPSRACQSVLSQSSIFGAKSKNLVSGIQ